MTASPTRSNDRIVWRALLVCAAFGLLVFVMMRVFSAPHPIVVDMPVTVPASLREETRVPEPSSRETAPVAAVEPARVEAPSPPSPPSGTAPLVHGRVRGRRAGPVSMASVRLVLERGSESEHLGDLTTDALGEFNFSSAALAAAFGTSATLRVDVEAGGFQPETGRYLLVALSPEFGIDVDLTLTSGALLSGRVVYSDDWVGGAEVTLFVANKSGSVTTFVRVTSTPSSADGKYRLGFDSGGEYRITARAEGFGTGVLEKIQLEAGTDHKLDDLVLAGGPPIVGRVVAAAGEPVRFLELWAIDGNYANEVDALARATLRTAQDERADGLTLTKTWTDGQGRFELGGLRPGHYALRSPDRLVVMEPRQARYEPGTKDVELVVSSQRLIVRVHDADQVPAENAGVRVTDLSTMPDGSYQASNTRTQAVHERKGVACFTLDPEAPVAVQAFDARRTSPEEIVILAQNEWTRELALTLSDETGKGRVRFDVMGEDGQPLTHLRIAALSSVTKIAREDLGTLETDANGVLSALPAGSYHFVVGYAPAADRDHFIVRTSTPVAVRANEETIVPLRARRGGRLRVALELRGTPPKGYAESVTLSPEERRDRFGTRVTLTPTAGGPATALQFRPVSGPGLVGAILPGETLLADVLVERGTYDIAIDSAAFALASPLRTVVEPGAVPELVVAVVAR